jgi:hypothetical protein
MTPPRPIPIRTLAGTVAAIAMLVQSTAAGATGWSLDKVYGERMAMRVADQRCQLFVSSISSALFMGEVQARNSALRSGMDADRLAEIADLAVQRGSTVACRDPALLTEAAHVRSAFSSYSRIQRMDFPGAAAGWKADRTVLSTRVEDGRWALTTTPVRAGANLRFGVVVQAGRLSLFAEPGREPGQMLPSAARLVLRDAQRTARPYLAGNLTPPPRASSTVFFAEARQTAPGGGTGFRFSDAAVAALVQLDPREAVQLEFVYPTPQGDRVVTGIYEVGDFAPAYGFLTVSR